VLQNTAWTIRGLVTVGLLMSVEPPDTAAQSDGSAQRPTFHHEVELVSLAVAVEGPDGSYVDHLGRDDFQVFDEGVLQRIEIFAGNQVPIDLMLMIDTSLSMSGRLDIARKAARNFGRALDEADRVALMSFGTSAELLAPFSTNRGSLEEALPRLRPGGSTALYTAVYVALREFASEPSESQIRRRAIVVLSDGEDTDSLVSFEHLMEEARSAGTAVYAVMLRSPARQPIIPDMPVIEMRRLARETGARFFLVTDINDLDGVYSSIVKELAHQYTIAFIPPDAPKGKSFRRVMVRVTRPGILTRTRHGYIAGN
jgi:Ca-activated chloride channel family protein